MSGLKTPRRVLPNGRSGSLEKRFRPKAGPGECGVEHWCWLSTDLLQSEAWRAMSPNTRRLIDRLLLEHAQHAGTMNGKLIATHEQLIKYGLSKNAIRSSIDEACSLGLLRFIQGGRYAHSNQPNLFRLTWMGWIDQTGEIREPTNDWKKLTQKRVQSIRHDQSEQRALKRAKRQGKRKTAPN